MDFFEKQDAARRKSILLFVLYIISLLFIVLLANLIFANNAVSFLIDSFNSFIHSRDREITLYWDSSKVLLVTAITLFIILSGSIFKTLKFSKGGIYIAELFGGTYVEPRTKDPSKRRLLNVVEEMSIASGIPVPFVYLLSREQGINAFSVGNYSDIAVIGVSEGCLKDLSREELQSVVAHGFGRVLYGDTRLYTKLTGILHGILLISLLGYYMCNLRSPPRGCEFKRSPFILTPAIFLGIFIMLVGYIGVFFSKCIKKIIMGQREYLADAAALQFTRNPAGLAGALKKMNSPAPGTYIHNFHAQESSHLFFTGCIPKKFSGFFTFHAPLEERMQKAGLPVPVVDEKKPVDRVSRKGDPPSESERTSFTIKPKEVLSSVGQVSAAGLIYANETLKSIPEHLTKSAHTIKGAEVVAYSLLISKNIKVQKEQLWQIKNRSGEQTTKKILKTLHCINNLPDKYRLPLLEISVSTLKNMPRQSYIKFRKNINSLIKADGKISLLEYVVYRMVINHLNPIFTDHSPAKITYNNIESLMEECSLLLSTLTRSGVKDNKKRDAVFKKAAAALELNGSMEFFPIEKCKIRDLDKTLKKLNRAAPKVKKKIIEACVTCVAADGIITIRQSELIRIISDALGCPVPPLFPGKVRQQE